MKLPTRSYSDFDDTADGPSCTFESRPRGGSPLTRHRHARGRLVIWPTSVAVEVPLADLPDLPADSLSLNKGSVN